jgi:hypothetical protein
MFRKYYVVMHLGNVVLWRKKILRLEDAEDDIRELKTKRWRNRRVIKKMDIVVKEGRVLRGPYSQGVSRL